MTTDPMAQEIQDFQDEQWAVPLGMPPTKTSTALAERLRKAGYIHRSHASTVAIDDMLAKQTTTAPGKRTA